MAQPLEWMGSRRKRNKQNLDANIQDLLTRLKAKRYRHQPIRRVHIPKDKGCTRPIGVSSIEDKVVQGAIREVLQSIYEQDFLDCSYGFRPKRSAHDAIKAIHRVAYRGEVQWVLEADVQSFFDSLSRVKLKEMLQIRIADGQMMRLIGKYVPLSEVRHSWSAMRTTLSCSLRDNKTPSKCNRHCINAWRSTN
jgi:RNA-directed DNA polymerase